jgi:serine/threonine-protein kinase
MIGQTVGKYRVVDRIGRGGMGTVYRATDDSLQRDVAIKILNTGLNDPEVAKRFRAEAVTVARLSHPGIATVYELFEHDGQWLMVMEYVRGETLEALIDRSGPLSPERGAEVCLHALAALAHAHHLGVVHRDLKPANLMLTEAGVVKVMDFGIARVSGAKHLTGAGFMMGTPAYMSPEQVLGTAVDARADVYAMGVVFYRLVTGTLPFTAESPFALAQSQVNDPPTPIGLVRKDLPPWVDQVVSRALAKNPQERFQSAAAFHDALSRCVSGRESSVTYDPTAPTEMMVTPPFAMPTGSIRPVSGAMPVPVGGDTIPMNPATGPRSAAVPAPAVVAQSFARANRLVLTVAGAIVVVTVATALIWNGIDRAKDAPSGVTDPVVQNPAPPTPAPPAAPPVSGAAAPKPSTPDSAPGATKPATPPPTTAATTGAASSDRGAPGRSVAAPRTGALGRGPLSTEEHSFPKVNLVLVDGANAREEKTRLNLSAGRSSLVPTAGGKVVRAVQTRDITKATYVHAEKPEFDPALNLPSSTVKNWPGVRSQHWLVLQSKSSFTVLRLEESTRVTEILSAFEKSMGLTVVKTTPPK